MPVLDSPLNQKFSPDRAVIRRFLHRPDVVINSRVFTLLNEVFGSQNKVYTQPSSGFTVKALAAVVKPAETVIRVGIEVAVGVIQSPVVELLYPLPLFRQATALAASKPASFIVLAAADIPIQRLHLHIAP